MRQSRRTNQARPSWTNAQFPRPTMLLMIKIGYSSKRSSMLRCCRFFPSIWMMFPSTSLRLRRACRLSDVFPWVIGSHRPCALPEIGPWITLLLSATRTSGVFLRRRLALPRLCNSFHFIFPVGLWGRFLAETNSLQIPAYERIFRVFFACLFGKKRRHCLLVITAAGFACPKLCYQALVRRSWPFPSCCDSPILF